ncbi:MAG: SsrA-binding protein [Alphaproteobacteria bacterium MarineAlpha5_Bin5]|nr:MAG: SsrA-binding protein [Alphaproteobacteria bacterium MarineAlpha5_Bin4]PPR49761.1 MAG: SsrA-binding protein [Alphaproteobacteria bacterium MarineAlpha5_Bin5]|tara:strand:- start:271 stop:717 length:447 start_codon:yes stop_codon:yes gene_type:complete
MKIIAANKRANYDYLISLKVEAGIVLTGSEVKSLRENTGSIKESYIQEKEGELWLLNCYIKRYASSSDTENNPIRERKLLINKKEFNKVQGAVKKEGFSIVPILLYFNEKGLAKLTFGLGKGKKKFDKRESEKTKVWNRKKLSLLKNN